MDDRKKKNEAFRRCADVKQNGVVEKNLVLFWTQILILSKNVVTEKKENGGG